MTVRDAPSSDDIAAAIAVDVTVNWHDDRSAYIKDVAAQGGLLVGGPPGQVRAFACLDHRYFFQRPFLSLLIVHPDAQRQGWGRALLQATMQAAPGTWTSTNRSNRSMQALVGSLGWHFCGQIDGLDPGDPELFFRAP
jgi:GNAT superfamily N-acetyltransferase